VVELFTGPGVTDAARADLKKELTKKGVRKTIVDSVLSQILSKSVSSLQTSDGLEAADAGTPKLEKPKGEYIPPSLQLLQQRRPLASSQDAAASVRVASSSSLRDISRPSSRAGQAPLAASVPATPTTESSDVRPVYVSFYHIFRVIIANGPPDCF
jgi:CLIP-associating protein 1/2